MFYIYKIRMEDDVVLPEVPSVEAHFFFSVGIFYYLVTNPPAHSTMPKVTFDPEMDIPDLTGQVIIVTGGNAGLGFESIRQLAKHNPAHIYLAARSKQKAEEAIQKLKETNPQCPPISFLSLDLASFASIKAAARTFMSSESRLDILMNNAGIMDTPKGLTEDGYEVQFGTNSMGPALFTQLLMPVLQRTGQVNPEARVVFLSSGTDL